MNYKLVSILILLMFSISIKALNENPESNDSLRPRVGNNLGIFFTFVGLNSYEPISNVSNYFQIRYSGEIAPVVFKFNYFGNIQVDSTTTTNGETFIIVDGISLRNVWNGMFNLFLTEGIHTITIAHIYPEDGLNDNLIELLSIVQDTVIVEVSRDGSFKGLVNAQVNYNLDITSIPPTTVVPTDLSSYYITNTFTKPSLDLFTGTASLPSLDLSLNISSLMMTGFIGKVSVDAYDGYSNGAGFSDSGTLTNVPPVYLFQDMSGLHFTDSSSSILSIQNSTVPNILALRTLGYHSMADGNQLYEVFSNNLRNAFILDSYITPNYISNILNDSFPATSTNPITSSDPITSTTTSEPVTSITTIDPVTSTTSSSAQSDLFLSSPSDVSYSEGSTGNTIAWIPQGSNPSNYEVNIDGNLFDTGSWASDIPISVNIDGLSVGEHQVILTIYDDSGHSASDLVRVIVTAESSQNNDSKSATTPNNPLPYSGDLAALTIMSFVLLIRRRRKA